MIPPLRTDVLVVPQSTDDFLITNPTYAELAEHAREFERKFIRLKLFHDNWLNTRYEPYLAETPGLPDAELIALLRECGWPFAHEEWMKTPGEWQQWLNRFRRLIAALKASGVL